MGRAHNQQHTIVLTENTPGFDAVLGARRGLAPGQASAVDTDTFPYGNLREAARLTGMLQQAQATSRGGQVRADALTAALRYLNGLHDNFNFHTENQDMLAATSLLLGDERCDQDVLRAFRADVAKGCSCPGAVSDDLVRETVQASQSTAYISLAQTRGEGRSLTLSLASGFADGALLEATRVQLGKLLAASWVVSQPQQSPLRHLLGQEAYIKLCGRSQAHQLQSSSFLLPADAYPDMRLNEYAWASILNAWSVKGGQAALAEAAYRMLTA